MIEVLESSPGSDGWTVVERFALHEESKAYRLIRQLRQQHPDRLYRVS